MKPEQDSRTDPAGFDQLLDAGIADSNQSELSSGKERIRRNQEQDEQDPEQHKGNHRIANSNIPKLLTRSLPSVPGITGTCRELR
jgi:hypothetical protein